MIDTVTIARICWDAHRSYCASIGETVEQPWDVVAQNFISGVAVAIANPTSTTEDYHQTWMNGKIIEGWRHGDVLDVKAKTHPALVPYVELPEAQQVKGRLFLAIVRALAPQPDVKRDLATEHPIALVKWMAELGAELDRHVGKHHHRAVDWAYWMSAYEAGKTPAEAVTADLEQRAEEPAEQFPAERHDA